MWKCKVVQEIWKQVVIEILKTIIIEIWIQIDQFHHINNINHQINNIKNILDMDKDKESKVREIHNKINDFNKMYLHNYNFI